MGSAFDYSFTKALSDCLNGCFLYPLSVKAKGINLECVKEFRKKLNYYGGQMLHCVDLI